MIGMSATTGRALGGIDHLQQSIRDILTTPIGTRVMRRDYGSTLFELVDAPVNPTTQLLFYAATAEALAKWEPRFKIAQVIATNVTPGSVEMSVFGEYLPDGQKVTVDGVVVK